MRRSLSLFLCATALAFVSTPGLVVFSRAHLQQEPIKLSGIGSLSNLPARVTAIFELSDPGLVEHESSLRPASERGNKIEFASARAAGYEAMLAARQADFEARATSMFPDARIAVELRKLANAVSIRVAPSEVAQLALLPGVRKVELAKAYHATLDKSVPLINAPAFWEKVGGGPQAGKGVKIAILDTGIDITNPLFAPAGFTAPSGFPRGDLSLVNNKVIVARAFQPDPSVSADDQNGHGTNVAGIAAGDVNTATPIGLISGVAPGAYLGNYSVLDPSGAGSDDLIAQGLEAAVSDGFDIANMSLGGAAGAQLGLLDNAVDAAVAAGMVVVVAAGNGGPKETTIASPGLAPDAITVAASSNGHLVGPAVNVTGPQPVPANLQNIQSTPGGSCPDPFVATIGPLAYFNESTLPGTKRGCRGARLPSNSLLGKIALIERGICSFSNKINNAAAAGAIGVVVYNQSQSEGSDGGDTLITMDTTGTTIPSVFIKRSDGLALVAWLASNPGAVLAVAPSLETADPADVLASFSSRGPTTTGTLKPDIAAPGVNIYSGAIVTCTQVGVSDPSGFASISGTSQATPHVSGAAALVKQMHPSWTPEQIKSCLVDSAANTVVLAAGQPGLAGVLQVGGGRLDLQAAANVTAIVSPSNLSFGATLLKKRPVSVSETLSITNASSSSTNLTISVNQLQTDTHVSIIAPNDPLPLGAGQTANVTITINATKRAVRQAYTGYVVIGPAAGQQLRVPYWISF